MMNRLDRYIGVTVAASTFMVLLVLLALFTFGAFVTELDDVGRGRYSLALAAQYVLFSVPQLVYQLFPVAALLGAVTGLGVLASNNELTVMRAAGVSLARITLSVMKVGLVWVALVTVTGEYLAPRSEHHAQAMRTAAIMDRAALATKGGLWARDDHTYVHVRDVVSGAELGGVTIYHFDERGRLLEMTEARSARYEREGWRLRGVVRSVIDESGVSSRAGEDMLWRSRLKPDVVGVVAVKAESLSIAGLFKYVDYLRANGLSAARYEAALWQKLMSPLATAVMVFLAVSFVFGPLRSVGVGQRVLAGALTGIAFYLLNQSLGHVGMLYDLNPAAGAVLPAVLFFTVAVVLMRRAR